MANTSKAAAMTAAEGFQYLHQIGLDQDQAKISAMEAQGTFSADVVRDVFDSSGDNHIDGSDICMSADNRPSTMRFAEAFTPSLADELRGDLRPYSQHFDGVTVNKRTGEITLDETTYPAGTFSTFSAMDGAKKDQREFNLANAKNYGRYGERSGEYVSRPYSAVLARDAYLHDAYTFTGGTTYPKGTELKIDVSGHVVWSKSPVAYNAGKITIPADAVVQPLRYGESLVYLPHLAEFLGYEWPSGSEVKTSHNGKINSAEARQATVIDGKEYRAGVALFADQGKIVPGILANPWVTVRAGNQEVKMQIQIQLRFQDPSEQNSKIKQEWLTDPARIISMHVIKDDEIPRPGEAPIVVRAGQKVILTADGRYQLVE